MYFVSERLRLSRKVDECKPLPAGSGAAAVGSSSTAAVAECEAARSNVSEASDTNPAAVSASEL